MKIETKLIKLEQVRNFSVCESDNRWRNTTNEVKGSMGKTLKLYYDVYKKCKSMCVCIIVYKSALY